MDTLHIVVGVAVIATSLGAGAWGAYAWWRGQAAPGFWTLLRISQAVLVVQVLLGGALLATGREPADLHLLYGVLPVAITFLAEQLRIVSAEQVLNRYELESARDMESLTEEQQRLIVFDIVRRETGVMAASALVVTLLALRASGVAGFIL